MAVLGAVAQATDAIQLMTYVTCPTMRYHPAVVAQKAATMQLLSDGRFTLGVGAGENLNEHVVGGAWPPADVRHEMLEEAVEIIRALFGGEPSPAAARTSSTENARDLGPPVRAAADRRSPSPGAASCELAGRHADVMIAVQPDAELGESSTPPEVPASPASGRSA